jgi:hypothetical protein
VPCADLHRVWWQPGEQRARPLCYRPHLQVSYFYDPECFKADGFMYGPTAIYYGYRHPMKPHRIGMTHSLLMNSAYWPSLQARLPAPTQQPERY